MARTTIVKAARKEQPGCMSPTCTHESRAIPVGSSYKWFKLKLTYGGIRKVYHTDCNIPQSHRTSSQHLASIYDAQEEAERAIGGLSPDCGADEIRNIAEQAADAIMEAAESYRESASNIEEGFGHSTYVSDELNEKGDSVEEWAEEIRDVDIEDFDRSEVATDDVDREDFPEDDEAAYEEAVEAHVNSQEEEWFDNATAALQDVLGQCPV